MINKLFLLISISLLASCAWQNETIKSYNEKYDCQIDGGYFTKVYTDDEVNIIDKIAYDKNNKPITGVNVHPRTFGDTYKSCWVSYYKEGKLLKENHPLLGTRVYRNDGIIEHYEDGEYIEYYKDNDSSICYYPNGQIKSIYPNKNGLYIAYSPEGMIDYIANYKNDNLNGNVFYYYPDGIIKQKAYFKNNKREGVSNWYYPSGKIRITANFKHGKKEGKKINYYEDGHKRKVLTYKNGRLNGLTTVYLKDGPLLWSMNFVDGMLHGDSKIFNKGKLNIFMNFKSNKAISGYFISNKGKKTRFTKEDLKEYDFSEFNKVYSSEVHGINEIHIKEDEHKLFDKLIKNNLMIFEKMSEKE